MPAERYIWPIRRGQLRRILALGLLALSAALALAAPAQADEGPEVELFGQVELEATGFASDAQFAVQERDDLSIAGQVTFQVKWMGGDVSFRLTPITDQDASAMMEQIRAWPLLKGVRGEPGVRLEAVKEALLRVSRLVQDFRRITEFDVNPFIAHEDPDLCRAVDVRFRFRAD